MTTFTTVLALVPMALGFGEGSEMNAPMGRVVIGGMLVSSMFTLFFVPTLYGSIKGIGK
jgi:HAE1 family hydrophobic/amphiphilic exporter-1